MLCRVSELRAVELLDDLCEEMRHYSLVQLPLSDEDKAQQRTKRRRQWIKVKGDGAQGLAEGMTRCASWMFCCRYHSCCRQHMLTDMLPDATWRSCNQKASCASSILCK